MLSFFPRNDLDEIWDLAESVSEGSSIYSSLTCDGRRNYGKLRKAHKNVCQFKEKQSDLVPMLYRIPVGL